MFKSLNSIENEAECKSSNKIYSLKPDWELIDEFNSFVNNKKSTSSQQCYKKHVKNKFSDSSTEYFGKNLCECSKLLTKIHDKSHCMSNLIDSLPNTSYTSLNNMIDIIPSTNKNAQTITKNFSSNSLNQKEFLSCQDEFTSYCFDNFRSPLANCTNNERLKNKKHNEINKRLAGIVTNSDENSIQIDLFENEEIIRKNNYKRNRHRYNSQTSLISPISSKCIYSNIQTISTELTSISEMVTDEVFEEPLIISEKQLEELSLNDNKINIMKPLSYNPETNMGVKRNFGSINSTKIDSNTININDLTSANKKLKICDRIYSSVCGINSFKINKSNVQENLWLPTPIAYSEDILKNSENILISKYKENKLNDEKLLPKKILSLSKSYDIEKSIENNFLDENQIVCNNLFNSNTNKNFNRRLIGDLSRFCILPVIEGKHNDLLTLKSSILSEIVNLYYNPKTNIIEYQNYNIYIIDCRYPYEFEGGHILSATNIHKTEDINSNFIDNVSSQLFNKNGQIPILIFHCEFSSKRGPRLARYLRNQDRNLHKECYPKLYYPEIYILQGGYCEFYQDFSNLCIPKNYVMMDDKRFSDELSLYRKESKSTNSFSDRNFKQQKLQLSLFKRRIL